jgi:prepilin-type N-terminal cleavage/methylation domain-containing protein
MRKQKGFSLIELLIVVAIILIIAAIAIPNLLRARIAANESASVSAIRTVNTAEVTYATAYPTKGYSDTLGALGGAPAVCATPAVANACLIDNVLASATASSASIRVRLPALRLPPTAPASRSPYCRNNCLVPRGGYKSGSTGEVSGALFFFSLFFLQLGRGNCRFGCHYLSSMPAGIRT